MTEDRIQVISKALQAMIDAGWTAAAISKMSEVNQITIGNLKNGKGSRVTDKVFERIMTLKQQADAGEIEAPTRRRKGTAPAPRPTEASAVMNAPRVEAPTAKRMKTSRTEAAGRSGAGPSDFSGMINTKYVPVDVERLLGMIDALISRFSGAIEELESIKSQLGN